MSTSDRSQTEITPLPREHSRQRGLSLIELLVALGLGVIIVAALSQLFLSISRTNLEMAKTNSQIENARFAMQFLQDDIVHAGYWGGFIPEFDDLTLPSDDPATIVDEGVVPTDAPVKRDPAAADPDNLVCRPFVMASDPKAWDKEYRDYLLGIPVEVYGPGALPVGCNPPVDMDDRWGHVLDVVDEKGEVIETDETDLLIVRHVATCVAGEGNCEDFDLDELYLRVSNCLAELPPYQLDPDATPLLTQLDCTEPADPRKFVQNIYYIRDWAYEDEDSPNGKDGIPTLVRSEFDLSSDGVTLEQQDPEPLVEGIEMFHVELGIDRKSQTGGDIDYEQAIIWEDNDIRTTLTNRGDGVPEAGFVRCLSEDAGCTSDDLSNVVAVKIYVLARAIESTPGYTDDKTYTLGSVTGGPFNDSFKRHVFSSTVRIQNLAGRRETSGPEVVVP